jgi:hypothetical protein
MIELLNITFLVECHQQGLLSNGDIFAIQWSRYEIQHKLLSLPTGEVLLGASGVNGFYECCQLSAIMFTTAVLFPMPRWTGVPHKLIQGIKQCVDQTHLALLISDGARPFFIWALMLAGIAATGMPERRWAEETLTDLLAMEGVSRWSELRRVVESFLWMDSACDGGAMELWDRIAAGLRR